MAVNIIKQRGWMLLHIGYCLQISYYDLDYLSDNALNALSSNQVAFQV